ncbi:DNA excision repair protein ERCC-6-like [Caerostris darwini]|uniref:DNA repair and recombination protein RAD54-like n=1 Tax=Caerostris darwini TaxID=1538125 RepID=A0AAV4WGQ0_9ARAC|nr:DNA excision repair protein ERCC-6-like [Caerostris darwini]
MSDFEELQKEGKRLAAEGKLYESLHRFELARKIKETPKVLSRIQRLKDAIAEKTTQKSKFTKEEMTGKSIESSAPTKNSEETSGILSQIQNIEVKNEKKPINPEQLCPEKLKKFNELKNSAIELSYVGKIAEAIHNFSEAQKLCDCPKVKKYIKELEGLVSKYPKKLEKFQNLTDSGRKLASAGKQTESLKKLKNAYAVCPSPKVSKMIKLLEAQNPPPKFPSLSSSSPEDHQTSASAERDCDVFTRIDPPKTVSSSVTNGKKKCQSFVNGQTKERDFAPSVSISQSVSSDTSKERNFTFSNAKSSSSGSETCRPTQNNPTDLSPNTLSRYKSFYKQARDDAAEGKLQEALDALLKAKAICPAEKILKRIEELKDHIKRLSVESSTDMIEVCEGFSIFHEIYEKLYPYQKVGVAWMWGLFKRRKGGVLGDDMGLGKTFQVIAFLSGLIDADLAKHILIVMPVSLLPNWGKEFKKWCPGISVSMFHGGTKKERERNLMKVQRRGHVLLTSYGMLLNALESLTNFNDDPFVWDYLILDEGHKIKNPTKTTKAVHAIPSKNRLVLTGTPIQNNLLELWALYDFAHQGTLLGSLKTFKMQYENTITRAREKDSTVGEKRLGNEMAESLKKLIKPYFLRRTKAEVWGKNSETSDDVNDLEKGLQQLSIAEKHLNTRKNDLILWTFLSDAQCEIYRNFLHSDAVKTILVSKRSPLVELTALKKICDHPRLLSQRACTQLGLNGEINEEDLHRQLNNEASYSSSIENVTDETLMAESGKMKFLIQLLENLKNEGHRTLVFSLSRKILDMIHRILINKNWKVMRIDGTISKIEERERRIQLFQTNTSYSVFLLTTQVGGVGITLTAADRVVIYDPSWNPATDAQAVDRVYRIGQQKNVVVYRLITCGTVEEKIYRRQIFKDSITKQATGSSDPYRYFSKQELRELFTFDSPRHSATQVQLSRLHSHQRSSDVSLDAHIAFLHSLDIFGVSDHDLMFSREIEDETEDNDEEAVSHDFIKKQVAVAQELIQTEGSVIAEGIRLAGAYSRPYTERIPSFKKNYEKDAYKPPSLPEYINLADKDKTDDVFHTYSKAENSQENADKLTSITNYFPLTMDTKPKTLMNQKLSLHGPLMLGQSSDISKVTSEDNSKKNDFSGRMMEGRSLASPKSKSRPRSSVDTKISSCDNKMKNNSAPHNDDTIEIIPDIHCTYQMPETGVTISPKLDESMHQSVSSDKSDPSQNESVLDKSKNSDGFVDEEDVLRDVSSPLDKQHNIHSFEEKNGSFHETKQSDSAIGSFSPGDVTVPSDHRLVHSTPNYDITALSSDDLAGEDLKRESVDASISSYMADLSFDDKPAIKMAKRISCAKPREFIVSESESSCPSSEEDDDFIVSDSEDEQHSKYVADSANSSICFVPSSIPGSPAERERTFRGIGGPPAVLRITPLQVRKSLCPPPDRAFAEALANSPLLTRRDTSSHSGEDSPVVKTFGRKARRNVIESDDED